MFAVQETHSRHFKKVFIRSPEVNNATMFAGILKLLKRMGLLVGST